LFCLYEEVPHIKSNNEVLFCIMDNTRLLACFQREEWQGFSLEERRRRSWGVGILFPQGEQYQWQVIIIAGSLHFFFH
jgi:hypothetical protein